MDGKVEVPEFVLEIIQEKKLEMRIEQDEKQRAEAEKRASDIIVGREALRLAVAKALADVPEWVRQYDATEAQWDDDNLERIGKGYDRLDHGLWLWFEIPGLAPIQFDHPKGNWRSADAYERWKEYGPAEIHLDFTRECYWRSNLDYTLVEAEETMRKYGELLVKFQQEVEEQQRRTEANAQCEEETEAERIFEREIKLSEEQELFDALKNDPVAVHLMKAFLMVRQERSMFEERINEADESVCSMEDRWSQKAADLRRQAQDADRRAEEERSRASDLEDDLDQAKKKLKQTERGW